MNISSQFGHNQLKGKLSCWRIHLESTQSATQVWLMSRAGSKGVLLTVCQKEDTDGGQKIIYKDSSDDLLDNA